MACLWLCTCHWLDISVRTITTDNSFTDILIARQKHVVMAAHERIALKRRERRYLCPVRKHCQLRKVGVFKVALLSITAEVAWPRTGVVRKLLRFTAERYGRQSCVCLVSEKKHVYCDFCGISMRAFCKPCARLNAVYQLSG